MNISEINSELSKLKTFPEYRILSKRIAKDDYRVFLDNNPKDSFEMKILYGYVLGYARDDIDVLLRYFEDFIPYVGDWAVCDTFCQSFKTARKHRAKMFELLMKYRDSRKEFESRVVSVTLLSHFLVDDYIDEVIEVLDNLYDGEYYAMMGTAWAIATIMAKYPDKCVKYLKSNVGISDRTYNKALQKCRESFRVSKEIKDWTKTVKKQ